MDLEALFEEQTDGVCVDETHPAFEGSRSSAYNLFLIPLNKIGSLYEGRWSSDWVSWFESEVNLWEMDFGDEHNRWLELEKIYLGCPQELPINLIKGSDGFYYIDDGHHRFAIATKHALGEIWAIVKG